MEHSRKNYANAFSVGSFDSFQITFSSPFAPLDHVAAHLNKETEEKAIGEEGDERKRSSNTKVLNSSLPE
jgi:hypothetical protein